ncbi:MAG: heterodisulfide reductase-related iron-sulfur binding cluster, partial [Planctomycetota bacterium]|nr:heterodisulfide reductase-related iron-sulfur binding cluster [Planctomycetota bacterium]
MKVGLFIPCYIDQLYPQVGMATVKVLESQGIVVEVPANQTCCGQPMANTGCTDQAHPLAVAW